ncbi:MAG: hypothetical protein VYD87_16540 [Pseudomonadota bacterium]|nr:hypothetical protein [Pseudomonadota bacterium]
MRLLSFAAALAALPAAASALTYVIEAPGLAGPVAVTPLQTAESLVDFYGYAAGRATPPFAMVAGRAQFFLVETSTETGAAALGLGAILGPGDGDGSGSAIFSLYGAPGAAFGLVRDDPGSDMVGWSSDPDVNGAFSFAWGDAQADGFLFAGIGAATWTMTFSSFAGISGITDWTFLSGDATDPTVLGLGALNFGALTVTASEAPEVPLPAAAPMLAAGLAGLALIGRGRRARV